MKKVMSNISETVLKEKLTDWTASSKVQELLGLTSVEETIFKKELASLVEKGIIERTGAKKGLKFRFKSEIDDSNEVKEVEKPTKTKVKIKQKKAKVKKVIDVSEIECEVCNMVKNDITTEVTNVPIDKLLSFIVKNPGEHSYSISIKRTQKGICVKTYRDIFIMSEVNYTKENFLLLVKASGITLEP